MANPISFFMGAYCNTYVKLFNQLLMRVIKV